LKKIALIVFILLLAFVVTGYLLPKQVHVERSITIDRPVTMMFELLDGYRHFNDWSPWADRDPNAEFIISGPESGVGARMDWVGEPHLIGSGWQEIVTSKPYESIGIKLDFETQGLADTRFILVPQGSASKITWVFDTDVTRGLNMLDAFLARYFGLLFDRWIGGDYEQGLANLKRYAESLPVSDFSLKEIERVEVQAQDILYVTTSSAQEPADIATAMAQAYSEISTFMNQVGIDMSGQPMAITRARDGGGYRFDAAIPVASIPDKLDGNIQSGKSPSGPAVRAIHHGEYDQMIPTYEKIAAYMSAHGLGQGSVSWEHYISNPGNTELQDMITHVYVMLDEQ